VNDIYHLDDDHQSYGMYDVVYYKWFFVDSLGGVSCAILHPHSIKYGLDLTLYLSLPNSTAYT
jgi:hypothetical protein